MLSTGRSIPNTHLGDTLVIGDLEITKDLIIGGGITISPPDCLSVDCIKPATASGDVSIKTSGDADIAVFADDKEVHVFNVIRPLTNNLSLTSFNNNGTLEIDDGSGVPPPGVRVINGDMYSDKYRSNASTGLTDPEIDMVDGALRIGFASGNPNVITATDSDNSVQISGAYKLPTAAGTEGQLLTVDAGGATTSFQDHVVPFTSSQEIGYIDIANTSYNATRTLIWSSLGGTNEFSTDVLGTGGYVEFKTIGKIYARRTVDSIVSATYILEVDVVQTGGLPTTSTFTWTISDDVFVLDKDVDYERDYEFRFTIQKMSPTNFIVFGSGHATELVNDTGTKHYPSQKITFQDVKTSDSQFLFTAAATDVKLNVYFTAVQYPDIIASFVPFSGQFHAHQLGFLPEVKVNTSDHSALSNLSLGDSHQQYSLSLGRSGGQTLSGGTVAADKLVLQSNTADALDGHVELASFLDMATHQIINVSTAGGIGALVDTNTTDNSGTVAVHSDVSSAGSGIIISAAERTAIGTNTTDNNGTVAVHSDVSSAGSGIIISAAERTAIGTNTSNGLDFLQALSTGITSGGVLSIGAGSDEFSITDGCGVIMTSNPLVDASISHADVSWTGKTNIQITSIGTHNITFIAIDSAGNVVQLLLKPTPEERRTTYIYLGIIVHVDLATVSAVTNEQDFSQAPLSQVRDLSSALGYLNISGNIIAPSATDLKIQKSSGTIYATGSNYAIDPFDPNIKTLVALDPTTFLYRLQSGIPVLPSTTDIDPNNYDLGGVLTPLTNNYWQIQRIYVFTSNGVEIQPGQAEYKTQEDALAAIETDPFITVPGIAANGLHIANLVVKDGASDLSTSDAVFIAIGKFGTTSSTTGISGDVFGPDPPVIDSNLCSFDTQSGKLIKDSQIAAADVMLSTGATMTGPLKMSAGSVSNVGDLVVYDGASTWTSRTVPDPTATYRSIAWSPSESIFCAIASGGTALVITSPDGINWTSRTPASTNQWYSVAWSPTESLFAAVASSGTADRVMTSPDGITWTPRVSAADNNWRAITWSPEESLFVAVSISGTADRVMTSPDGITWTIRTSAADSNWRAISWSPELNLFCAVGDSGTVMTSPDGITWTVRTAAAAQTFEGIAWSPELNLFCATGRVGNIQSSPDGINWTVRTSPNTNFIHAIIWVSEVGYFFAGCITGGDRLLQSLDGVNWTASNGTDGQNNVSFAWSPTLDMLCSLGNSGSRVMTSDLTADLRVSGGVVSIGQEPAADSDVVNLGYLKYGLSTQFSQVATKTITNTTSSVGLFNTTGAIGSNTFPANSLRVGQTWHLHCSGALRTTVAAVNIQFHINFGGGTIASTVATSISPGATYTYWEMETDMTVRSIGAAGTVWINGVVMLDGTAVGTFPTIAVIGSLDTTTALSFSPRGQWGASNVNNILNCDIASISRRI